MKRFIVGVFVFILSFSVLSCKKDEQQAQGLQGTITVSGAFALYPMMVCWSEKFTEKNPGVEFDISAGGAGKGMADALSSMVNLGMVSREISEAEVKKGAWYIPVARDAVVPMMNASNPHAAAIRTRGVTRDQFKKVFVDGTLKGWEQLSGNGTSLPVKVYTRSDACGAADVWALFLGAKQEDLGGVGVFGDPGLAQAVANDSAGIGYNNVCYAYNDKSGKVNAGLMVIPIDLNSDGKISEKEDFYKTRESLVGAIADGRYPSPPARDLYVVCKGIPAEPVVKEFLKWVLTDGQKYVIENGYIPLSEKKLNAGVESLK